MEDRGVSTKFEPPPQRPQGLVNDDKRHVVEAKPPIQHDLPVPAIYTERLNGGHHASKIERIRYILSVHSTQMPRGTLSALRPLALSALSATACFASTQSKFGNVPGNNYAVGPQDATYDYVVVGGGTAGLAIA